MEENVQGYIHSHEGMTSETKAPPQPYGRTHAQTRMHARSGNNYYHGLDLCVKSVSVFSFFFFLRTEDQHSAH